MARLSLVGCSRATLQNFAARRSQTAPIGEAVRRHGYARRRTPLHYEGLIGFLPARIMRYIRCRWCPFDSISLQAFATALSLRKAPSTQRKAASSSNCRLPAASNSDNVAAALHDNTIFHDFTIHVVGSLVRR